MGVAKAIRRGILAEYTVGDLENKNQLSQIVTRLSLQDEAIELASLVGEDTACIYDPTTKATRVCEECYAPLCDSCGFTGSDIRNRTLCNSCYEKEEMGMNGEPDVDAMIKDEAQAGTKRY